MDAAGGATVDVRIAGGATVAAGGATVAAGGATVDAAGGATVDVRTAAAGGAAAARTPAAAVAPPARLRPAIARAARPVRTDISVSLDDEEEPRDPRHLFDFSTNYTYAKKRVFKAVRGPAPQPRAPGAGVPSNLKLGLSVRLVLTLSAARLPGGFKGTAVRVRMAAWTISARSAARSASCRASSSTLEPAKGYRPVIKMTA